MSAKRQTKALELKPNRLRRPRAPFLEDLLRENRGPEPAPKLAYFNRELSWLAFNRRVLEQAENPHHPLLERVRFLAIVSSNLDEFFEIRVAGLIQQVESGVTESSLDGLGAREQLRRIHLVVASLVEEQYKCWHESLVPELARNGIVFKAPGQLTESELAWVRAYFQEQVFPVLTPLGVDPTHPFPEVSNKTLSIVVSLKRENDPFDRAQGASAARMAILPVPRILPRLVRIDPAAGTGQKYIFLTDVIKLCAGAFFHGYRVTSAHAFRVTRNSDLYIDEEEIENLLKKIEEELRNLRRGSAVRLEIEADVPEEVFSTLCSHLSLSHEYVFRLQGPLNLLRLQSLAEIDRPDLKFAPFEPVNISPLHDCDSPFEVLKGRDVLLHHPYDSFAPVVDFVERAARDPQVFAIKQTLYRTSGDSPIVRALMEAAKNGKQVTALVELRARFDEANNIQWARRLEEAGAHVIYGLVGHKTHCKLCLVVRQEGTRMRHYGHLGTGNYNPRTARFYTDISLFTSRETTTEEMARLFNSLTGFSHAPQFSRLIVAPYNLHRRIQELIAGEAARAAAGRPSRIIAKMNSLVDKTTIDNLYKASQAGVKIDLIVRGICCLVPGVRGLSENIRVRSIVGRFLEHARAFYFENSGDEPVILAGSADWMARNFLRRIEVLFPIDDPAQRRWFINELFARQLMDTENARELHSNGGYLKPAVGSAEAGAKPFSAQEHFMADAIKRAGKPDATPDDKPASALTPDEQMALYEKELKETDWGHQPC